MSKDKEIVQTLSHKVANNTFYNFVGRFWGVLISLFLAPYIIHRIGMERYGIWALAGVLTGYFGLLDFGIGTSFVKYIAEFYAKREDLAINRLVNTGFILYVSFTILMSILLLMFINPIIDVLKIPAYLHNEAVFVFFAGVIIFGISNTLSPFTSIQNGLQRMDVFNVVAIVMSTLNIIGAFFFLENGFGLPGLMVNNVINALIAGAINVYMSARLFPALRVGVRYVNKEMIMRILNFGYKMQVVRIGGIIVSQIDKLLISLFLSLSLVSFYQLGSSIVYQLISLAGLFTGALMPAFSDISSGGQGARLSEAYLRSMKYVTFFIAPVFVLAIISAPNIMALWMGGAGYSASSVVIQILAIGFILNAIAQVSASMCVAINKVQFIAKSALITTVLSTITSVALIKLFGFFGAAWGVAISVNLGTLYFVSAVHRHLKIKNVDVVKTVMPYIGLSVFAAGIVLIFDPIINRPHFMENRGMEFLVLAARSLIFFCVYAVSVYSAKLFNKDDMEFFGQRLKSVGRFS